jgi:ABC-type lipoprotein release transport system permease subunit
VVSVLDTGASSGLPFQVGHLLLAAFAAALVSMLSASFPAAKAARVRPYDALAAL